MKAIVAMTSQRVIGADGHLPWHLTQDLQWFKKLTMAQTLVMGRKTWDSIGAPLRGRTILILTRGAMPTGVYSQMPTIRWITHPDEVPSTAIICGGAEIYRLFWPKVEMLYLTRVKRDYPGDTLFPFDIDSEFSHQVTLHDDDECSIELLERRV